MINNIYCVGRNYAEHAQELGNRTESEPIIFSKPNAALVMGKELVLPDFSDDIHYETELVIKISRDGFQISEQEAEWYYDQIALGLDLTARDLQADLKERKLPWLLSKGFKDSCYVTDFVEKEGYGKDIHFSMLLNDVERQKGNTRDMVFSIDQIIAYISKFIPLKKSDIIFTGTPKGVGRLTRGNRITLCLENKRIDHIDVK